MWLTSHLGGSNRVPVLAQAEDGTTWVAWRNNPNGAAWGSAEFPEAIQIAKWSGNSWEATTTIASDIPGIVDLALAYEMNDGVIAWTVVHPSANIVTPTLQVFFSRFNGTNWSQPEQFTHDDSNHTKLQVVFRDGNPYLVWLADQQLTIADLSTKAVIGTSKSIRDELQIIAFRVIQGADHNLLAVFTGQESQQIDLYLSYFDEALGVWGEPRRLTNDKAEEKYPNVALTTTGDLFSVYSRTPITYQVVSEPLLDPTQQITYSIPIERQPDIYALVHTLGHNLTVESLDIAMPTSFESQNVTLTATVRNTADLPIYISTLDFVDNGVPFKSIGLPVLAAGDSTMFTATYSITAESGIRELAVIVDPQNTIIETDETDNQKQISAFGPDLKLESIDIQFWGGSEVGLVAQISNVGNTTMLASSVSFYITDTVLGSQSLPTILPGESVDIVLPWSFANLSLGVYEVVGYVSPDIGCTELITNNNMAYVSLPVQPNILVDPFVQTTSLMDVQIGITATIYNASIFPVNDVTVGIYRRSTIDDSSLVYTTVISSLPPNMGTEITTFIGGPLGCGIHVVADPYRTITETTYTDNIVSVLPDNGTCADFWNFPITGIAPLTVVFTDTSTGENSDWQWDFGNGFTSTLQSPTQIFTQSGSYTVTYTVIGQYGIDSIQRPQAVQVFAPAHASFSMSPSSGMSPLTVSFTNHSTGDYSTISWDFGDNNGSAEDNPLHTFEQSGTYTVTLKVDGFGGFSVTSQVIKILPWNKIYLPMVLRQ